MSHKKDDSDTRLMAVTSSNLNQFLTFFTDRFSGKSAIRWLLKIHHVIHITTFPCKMSLSENERHSQNNVAINDQSQGSVPIHLRCGAIFNSLLLQIFFWVYQWKKTFFKQVEIWQNCTQEVGLHVDDHEKSCFQWYRLPRGVYNQSFWGLCSKDTVKIFLSVN